MVDYADLMPSGGHGKRFAKGREGLAGFLVGRQGVVVAPLPQTYGAELELADGDVAASVMFVGSFDGFLVGCRRGLELADV